MRIALDDHLLGDAHAADFDHTADVVAMQVDQHEMFGELLRVAEQLLFKRRVLFWCAAARPRASQRPRGDDAVFEPNQYLRRRPDDLEIAEIQEEQIGRGVEMAQRAIDVEWRQGEFHRHALRQHHLHHIAIDDVPLDTFDRLLEGLAAELGLEIHFLQRRAV